jgi:hypothetical protein
MIFSPNNGPIGLQPVGTKVACINRQGSALAVGDVVITSFSHTEVVYPALETVTSYSATPFASVVKADGNVNDQCGYIGVVTSLLANAGADDTAVEVQFGGVVKATVYATTTDVGIGTPLAPEDDAGLFGNAAGTTTVYPAAISLGSVTAGSSSLINVLVNSGLWFQRDIQ